MFLLKPSKSIERLNVKDKKKSIGNNLQKKGVLTITIKKKNSPGMQPPATPA
jgi:hypothetical protein